MGGAERQLRGQVMKELSKHVGLDAHKETIAVAVADAGCVEVRYVGEIAHTRGDREAEDCDCASSR
jgi:hypothetical protein